MKHWLSSILVVITCAVFIPSAALAAGTLKDAGAQLFSVGNRAGTADVRNVEDITGKVINGALTLVGIIFLLLMVYAGYLWMTARGEEEPVTKAKKIVETSIIGLIIVMGAYAITVFVTGQFEKSGGQSCSNTLPGGSCVPNGSCTSGVTAATAGLCQNPTDVCCGQATAPQATGTCEWRSGTTNGAQGGIQQNLCLAWCRGRVSALGFTLDECLFENVRIN